MITEEAAFLILLIGNLLIALIYLCYHLIRNRTHKLPKNRSVVIRTIVMILCPVVGICFFGIGYVLYKTVYRTPVDLEDVVFSKDRVKTYAFADEEQERNIVPLEDAIAVSDTESLRSLMLNVVKGDIQESLSAISMALDSEDSETSHYAASVLQEALDKFRTNVQKGYLQICEDEKSNVDFAFVLFDQMNAILRQKVFTEIEQKSMVHMMDEIGDILYRLDRKRMSSEQMEAIFLRLLEIDEFADCQKWCERAEYLFPDELATYTCQLKLYFNTGNRNRFFRVLQDLKESDIIVDNETLELIRVFM